VLGGPFVLLLALSLAGVLHADVMLGYGIGLIACDVAAAVLALLPPSGVAVGRGARRVNGGQPFRDPPTDEIEQRASGITEAEVEALRRSLWSTWGKGRQTTDWPSSAELRAALEAAAKQRVSTAGVTEAEAEARVTAYTVNPDAEPHEWITVELTCFADGGPHKPPVDTWAVRQRGWCLNRDGEWEHEPIPSSRDDTFFGRCRFELDEALTAAAAKAREGRDG
jgi:hypothetical protein